MWKILICSEDRDFMRDLGHRIRRLAGERLKEIRLFSNKEDLDFYTTGRPEESNIILIDISRDNEGIQLAQKILAVQPHSQIIFMASTDKYYLDVYSVDHVYFLKKPIEAVFLMKALNKAGSRLQDMKKSYLVISNKQGIYKIPLYTILCFDSEKRKWQECAHQQDLLCRCAGKVPLIFRWRGILRRDSAGSTLLILKPLYSYTDFFFRRFRRDDFFRNSCALVSK